MTSCDHARQQCSHKQRVSIALCINVVSPPCMWNYSKTTFRPKQTALAMRDVNSPPSKNSDRNLVEVATLISTQMANQSSTLMGGIENL
eukprot:2461471-Amphidinium_carterae.1